ncbi:MAG: hypothetical protein Q8807_03360 ['Waltheria sp.' little leaf phytoplasma]|nr:hypothetical protein ['Waltheria sp.' little leaf phytoplasma]
MYFAQKKNVQNLHKRDLIGLGIRLNYYFILNFKKKRNKVRIFLSFTYFWATFVHYFLCKLLYPNEVAKFGLQSASWLKADLDLLGRGGEKKEEEEKKSEKNIF